MRFEILLKRVCLQFFLRKQCLFCKVLSLRSVLKAFPSIFHNDNTLGYNQDKFKVISKNSFQKVQIRVILSILEQGQKGRIHRLEFDLENATIDLNGLNSFEQRILLILRK